MTFGEDFTLLIGLGANRSGSTTMHQALSRHPDVHASFEKELHYWDGLRLPKGVQIRQALAATARDKLNRRSFAITPAQRASRYRLDLLRRLYEEDDPEHRIYQECLTLGRKNEPVVCEVTPAYALLSRDDFREIQAVAPDVKFLYVMRDPVDRLWSAVRKNFREQINADVFDGAEITEFFSSVLDDPDHGKMLRTDYRHTIQELEAATSPDRVYFMFQETEMTQSGFDAFLRFLGLPSCDFDAARRHNAGRSIDVKLTDDLIQRARDRLAPVYDYVSDRFGSRVPARWRV